MTPKDVIVITRRLTALETKIAGLPSEEDLITVASCSDMREEMKKEYRSAFWKHILVMVGILGLCTGSIWYSVRSVSETVSDHVRGEAATTAKITTVAENLQKQQDKTDRVVEDMRKQQRDVMIIQAELKTELKKLNGNR